MKTCFVLTALAILCAPLAASGDVLTLTPAPGYLHDLNRPSYYTWGIDSAAAGLDLLGLPITGASLVFKNLSSRTRNANDLWVELLDTAPEGVRAGVDSAAGDYFAGAPYAAAGVARTPLAHYANVARCPARTLTYTFDDAEMAALYRYIANGNDFALGFDPDGRFHGSGVELQLTYGPVPPLPEPTALDLSVAGSLIPEPTAMALIAAGSLVLARRRRRT